MAATSLAPTGTQTIEAAPTPVPKPATGIAALPARKKLMLGIGVAALAAIVAAAVMWSRQPDWRVLYANLADRDGGAVIAALSQMNVPYKFTDGASGAILVPADKVHDTRLKLASQGLPKGGIVGFELMENVKFGMTQFQERLNFQRGLEGELTRSIQSLAAVQAARVHLAMPNQTAFFREQQKPSASVVLTLHPGRTLDRAQVAGIVHLVASSVPELSPKQVSVIDQSGTLLSANESGVGATTGLDATQLQYVQRLEQTAMQRILDILEPVVGRQNIRAQVNAEVDFSQTESTAEIYKPNQGNEPAAVRSQQISDASGSSSGAAQGVPGALTNQPPATPSAPVNGSAQTLSANQQNGAASSASGGRRESVTNYEVDKTVRVTRNATGMVKRLSAAVVINHRQVVGADGKTTSTPLPAEQIEQINALVREAIGFSKDRGDSINVANVPFSVETVVKEPELPFWKEPENIAYAKDIGKQGLLVLLGLMVILFVIRPALRTVPRAPIQVQPRPLAVVEDDVPMPVPVPDESNDVPRIPVQPSSPAVDDLRQLARDNPATVANVLRTWMNKS
ncbi:MAG TPA: flagellar basal-body MS-ring/collar protein FliF [Burkholderiaceae bacterium]|nr:flagellar basal-body MS-ring/collar protein FliF [Burkholderiaceae bacterium]